MPLTTDTQAQTLDYLLREADGTQAEAERLKLQTQAYREQLIASLKAAELKAGDQVVILAGGTGEEIPLVQEIIGDTGHITIVDNSEKQLAVAQQIYTAANITFVASDVAAFLNTPANQAKFDFALSRNFLVHIPNPQEIIALMRNVVKPGGHIECVEVTLDTAALTPADEAYQQYTAHVNKLASFGKGNLNLGRDLFGLFGKAGYTPTETTHQPIYGPGTPEIAMLLLGLKTMAPMFMRVRLMDQTAIDAMREHFMDLLIRHPSEAVKLAYPMAHFVHAQVEAQEAATTQTPSAGPTLS